ncbi:MAG: ParA family protein, partial [SAR324 cluster bacterium]|nr:ParA family protein [SAR324 cluster bacterium]
IPANIHLAKVVEQVDARVHREKILHNHLEPIRSKYDFILLDCPPSLGLLSINAIYTADLILIPTSYGKYSLDGISDLFESIEDVKENQSFDYLILRNMFDARNKQTNDYIESQLDPFKDHVLKTIIRKTEAINQAQMLNEPVFTSFGKTHAAEDFKTLTQEVIKNGNSQR